MPRDVSVTVVIDDDTGQKAVRLLSDPTSGGLPIAQDHVLQFNNNQNGQYSDGFVVHFHLPDNQGKNSSWVFADPPIWVKLADKNGACPRAAKDHDPNILTNPTLSPDRRTLRVTNSNSVRRYFGFALRFESAGGGRTWEFDPIGDDQNGGKPMASYSYVTYAFVALGSGIVSALATVAALQFLHVIPPAG